MMTDSITSDRELSSRIVQYKGKRACIRLENVYWETLKQEASARNIRFNELVHSYYNSPEAKENRTAYLRRRAIEWMTDVVDDTQSRVYMGRNEIKSILRASTQPAIIFSETQSVSRFNTSFRDWVLQMAYLSNPNPDLDKLRISFRRSLAGIRRSIDADDGVAMNEQVSVLLPGLVLPVYMNVVAIEKYLDMEDVYFGIITSETRPS